MLKRMVAFAVGCFLLAALPLFGQTFRGSINGTVTDPSGAVVTGARVTVRNVDTGLERATETDGTGFFTVSELPIGSYSVTVEMSGFQTAVASGFRVEVATARRVDVTLLPGAVGETVEVTATVPLVETTSNVLGGAFESRQVQDLPINGRDFTKLLIMVPGSAGEPNSGGDSPGSFGLFSVNGNRGRSNNFLLDGTDMNDGYRNLPAINQGGVFGTPGTVLPVEAIAEVRILSNFEPEYGRNSGSVVNIVTKSGANDIHGSVFEFFRHDKLNARNFFNNVGPKDKFRNNQFGAAVGGPFKRDRAFWHVTYEGQRERLGVTSVNAVPTLADDFIPAINALGGDGTLCTSTIIGCLNAQAPGIVNEVILRLFNLCDTDGGCPGGRDLWPLANVSGAGGGGAVNNIASAPAFNDVDSFIVKIDVTPNDRHHLSGRYFFGDSEQSFPLGLAGGNNLPGTNTFSPIRTQLVSISHVYVPSTRVVNEARFGWNLYEQDFLAANRDVFGIPEQTFGLDNGVTDPRDAGLPEMRFGEGFSTLGSSGFSNPRGRDDTNWHFMDNVSWTLGRHDFKFGYEFRRTAVDSFNDFHFRGRVSFGSLVDFLDGAVTGFSFIPRGKTDREARQNSHALYAQDTLRWRRDFTLNLGLRWEYFGVIDETGGNFSTYDPTASPFGLLPVDRLYDRDWNNFSPRVSFAWDLGGRGRTVVRGGLAMFYDIFSQDFFTGQIFFNSFNAGVAYNAVGPNPILFSFSPVAQLSDGDPVFEDATFAGDTADVATVDPELRTPYVLNWNLNVQQELGGNSVFQVGYVGTGGRKLFRIRDINQPSQAAITAFDLAQEASCPVDPTTCPIEDIIVPRNFSTPLSLVAPNGPFYLNQLEASSTSTYHGLQLVFRQQGWRGLYQHISWTWSHSIDTASDGQDFVPNAAQPQDSTNARGDRGNSNFDVRHRFVWSLTYDFPRWEAAGRLGEGWQVGGILTLMSGHPFHLNYDFIDDYDGSGEFFHRPDLVGPVVTNTSDPSRYLDVSSFAVPCTLGDRDIDGDGVLDANDGSAVFCQAGTRHFATLGRNALTGPDYRNLDISIGKLTRITERFSILLRAEVFNVANRPNLANPYLPAFFADPAPNGIDPATGRSLGFLPIVATSDVGLGNPILAGGGPRSWQFAAKVIF